MPHLMSIGQSTAVGAACASTRISNQPQRQPWCKDLGQPMTVCKHKYVCLACLVPDKVFALSEKQQHSAILATSWLVRPAYGSILSRSHVSFCSFCTVPLCGAREHDARAEKGVSRRCCLQAGLNNSRTALRAFQRLHALCA